MKRFPIIFVILSLPLYLLDQITKWWIVFRFREPLSNDFHSPDEHVEVIDGFLWWWRIHNQGAAFGLGNGTSWAPFVFLLVLIFVSHRLESLKLCNKLLILSDGIIKDFGEKDLVLSRNQDLNKYLS